MGKNPLKLFPGELFLPGIKQRINPSKCSRISAWHLPPVLGTGGIWSLILRIKEHFGVFKMDQLGWEHHRVAQKRNCWEMRFLWDTLEFWRSFKEYFVPWGSSCGARTKTPTNPQIPMDNSMRNSPCSPAGISHSQPLQGELKAI